MGQENKDVGSLTDKKRKIAGQTELRTLVESQQFCCALSGVALSPNEAVLDHIKPVTLGGNHSVENLQVLHVVVNRMKGTMTNREFITWCRIIAATADI